MWVGLCVWLLGVLGRVWRTIHLGVGVRRALVISRSGYSEPWTMLDTGSEDQIWGSSGHGAPWTDRITLAGHLSAWVWGGAGTCALSPLRRVPHLSFSGLDSPFLWGALGVGAGVETGSGLGCGLLATCLPPTPAIKHIFLPNNSL